MNLNGPSFSNRLLPSERFNKTNGGYLAIGRSMHGDTGSTTCFFDARAHDGTQSPRSGRGTLGYECIEPTMARRRSDGFSEAVNRHHFWVEKRMVDERDQVSVPKASI